MENIVHIGMISRNFSFENKNRVICTTGIMESSTHRNCKSFIFPLLKKIYVVFSNYVCDAYRGNLLEQLRAWTLQVERLAFKSDSSLKTRMTSN